MFQERFGSHTPNQVNHFRSKEQMVRSHLLPRCCIGNLWKRVFDRQNVAEREGMEGEGMIGR
jgi:hypothetical protein